MGRRSFTHLHTHTEYSMLDGASRIGDAVAAAVADGQPALGITDHGNMYGVLDFYRACRDAGINPVIGTEAYMAAESRHERPSRRGRIDDTGGDAGEGQKLYYHLTLLAETTQGYKNLLKLSSEAYLSGYFYKPRADWELLEQFHEGLIATTGCLGGVVLQAILNGNFEAAVEKAARLQDIFGRDSLFVELQDHGLAAQHQTNPQLIELAKRIRAPLLATNDSHYTHRHDAEAHDALLCVQTGALMSDTDRFKFEGDEHYLKTAAEMRHLFRDWEEACDNTLWIAERAHVDIEFGKPELPRFPLPEGFATDTEYLRHLTVEGAKARYGEPLPAEVMERLDYELGVIDSMGFSAYFLVVWDLIRFARESGIRVGPGRGSAAGCCVAYCLRIVDLDPIRYDLLFERFLNPGRKQMPDIDMDFDSRRRGDMIKYAAEKYGWDRVAQIVTFSTIKARAAVRDASRVLGYPYAVGDKIAKLMPPLVMGRDTPLWACFEKHPKYDDGYKTAAELRQLYETDPDAAKVVDVARGLEGLRRQDGIHAAAVVITKDPLTEYLPIQRKPEAGAPIEDAPIVTQYEMHGVEELGLLKMDFLGLRNLDVIEVALDLIEESTGTRPDIDGIPLDDEKTLDLLRKGDSIGVFQLEGGPMRALMRSLAPTTFEDVAALVALYRPGPMAANMHNDYADRKNGRKPIEYFHPDAEEILADTYGLMIYQESVMRVAQKFAGYSLEEADNLRKACLPKGTKVLTKARGYVPIEQLMALSDRRLHTIDTTSCTSRHEPVEDVWSVGVKPVLRLRTSTGYTIEATAEHPFLVEGEWRELGSIQPGDLVGVAAKTCTDGGSKPDSAVVDIAIATGDFADDLLAQVESAPLPAVRRFLDAYEAAYRDGDALKAPAPLARLLKRLLLRSGVPSTIESERLVVSRALSPEIDQTQRDLGWDTVVSVEPAGERECFDFRMANEERPYAVVEDFLVHNCGKKIRELMAKEREKFVSGVEATGYGKALGDQLFGVVEQFADYAFNKSHSFGYGFVAYQTAWLKANHPVEYLAALLTSVKDDKDKTAVYLAECRALGIQVLVPDVNRSASDFAARDGAIPFGLSAIRNVGEGLVRLIVAEREGNGPFADFYDFCQRVDPMVLNKRTVESLIKGGAFDSLGHPRKGLCLVFEQIVDRTLARRREAEAGVMSLFDVGGDAPDAQPAFDDTRVPIDEVEFDKMQRLAFEKEMLGLYVSDHPLMGAQAALRKHTECTLRELRELRDGELRWVGGVVTGLQRKYTKRGDLMAVFVLEDLEAAIEVMVFPRTMQEHGLKLEDDAIVCVKGRLDTREEPAKLIAMDITRPQLVLEGGAPITVDLALNLLDDGVVHRLKELLVEHPGDSPVFLKVGAKTVRLPAEFNVDTSNGLIPELRVLPGVAGILL